MSMALRKVVYTAAIFGAVADAIPTIAFPLNSQVPPAARVGQPFSYTFSTSTFSSTLPLTYTLSDAPQWLSLDGNTRTLSGTPSAHDAGASAVTGFNIELTASDQTGSATSNATLVISTNPAPTVSVPLTAQLASYGASSLPSTVLYHPSTSFNFKFDPETFSESGLNYYAVTLDNTPLPSWIQFDGSSLSFSGQTPDYQSLIQPPQTFDIQLIASDVEGFSAVSIPFAIEVGVHLLAFKDANMALNATAGEVITFDGLQDNIELDGAAIHSASIASITVQKPSWLTFDNTTLTLSGTVPADATSSNITVQATDIYGDTENAEIAVFISSNGTISSLWSSQIGSLNVTIGLPFTFNFSSYVENASNVEMTAQFSPTTSWIDFDSQSLVMSGTVPETAPISKVDVTLAATSKSLQASASQTFALFIRSGDQVSASSSSLVASSSTKTSTTSTHSPSSTTPISSLQSQRGLPGSVVAAIAIPLALLAVALVLALMCYLQRRASKKRRPRSPTKSVISGPKEVVSSSVVEVTHPARSVTPEALQLDTSGFITDISTSTDANNRKRKSQHMSDNPLRRSQTMSAVYSGQRRSDIGQSSSNGLEARARSDNELSRTDRSWRSTQDSSYPTASSDSRTNSSHRLTRNYSRKGQQRWSGRIISKDSALRDSTLSMRPQSTILNLADSNFSATPLDNFSALSRRTSTLTPSEFGSDSQQSKSSKRKSRFLPSLDQRSGYGHGGRESISSLTGLPNKRRSIGHGQNWESVGIPRDSRTWLTVHSPTREHDRLSDISGATEDTDVLEDTVAPLNIRTNNKPRAAPSILSQSSVSTRPVSRRAIGSSPFFAGGGSMKSSRKPNKLRTSYEDSPTVPEEEMVEGVATGLGKTAIPRDSFGISYGGAREGTRQLRSYIQNRLTRSKTNETIKSSTSRDSRFESADSSSPPQSQPNFVVHTLSSNTQDSNTQDRDRDRVEYEDYLAADYSDESWETHHSAPRDSLGNIFEYGLGESSTETRPTAQRLLLPPSTSTALRSHPASPLPMEEIGPNARLMEGRGRRPLSVDAGANKGSVRAVLEGDYSAYI